jgi:tetratricopeptide (TPR) repeat protein
MVGAMSLLAQTSASYEDRMAEGLRFVAAREWEQAIEAFREAAELEPGAAAPHLEMARAYLVRDDAESALVAVDRALARAASDVSARTLRGTVLLSMDLFDEARLELEVAVDRDPDDPNARRQLALASLRAGRADGTVTALSPLLEDESSVSPSDWALLGAALYQLGRAEEAVAPLERSLAELPDQPQALVYLGQSLLSLGRVEEALQAFQRGARLPPPENVRFELGVVETELELELEEKARGHLESLLERHPRVARGWFLLGVIEANEGRHHEAARAFESAIQHGHRSAQTYLNHAVASISMGDRNAALRSLAVALERDPSLAAAHYYSGILALEDGQDRQGIGFLEQAASLEPDEPRAYLALAEAYLKTRRYKDAREAAATAANLSDELAPRALYWKGLAHHEGIEYSLAEASYREAIALGLDDAEVHLNLGRALYAMAKHEEALAAVADALARGPGIGEAHLLKGKIEIELRHYESALSHLERASEILPGSADVWFRKGVVHSQLSNRARAIEDWRRALSLDPDMLDTYYRLGSALMREGELEEGEALLAEFQQRSSAAERQEHQVAKLKTTLRRALERSDQRRDEEALAYFAEALNIAPFDPLPYLYLAEFQALRGHMDLAETTLLRGLEKLPRHLSLHRALLSVYEASNLRAEAEAQRKRIAELELVR